MNKHKDDQAPEEPEVKSVEDLKIAPPADLVEEAMDILKHNDKGTHTVPSNGLYPHQWLWDSCFIAIGQAKYDVDRAKAEILSLLRGQWHNGMIPSIILWRGKGQPTQNLDRHEKIWRSWLNPNAPDEISTSGITQPPMLAEAISRIGAKLKKTDRKIWYKQVIGPLIKYHEWLYSERDPHNEGLVLLIHPWEVGLDNTPPWMHELNDHLLPGWIRLLRLVKLDTVVGWFRSDGEFVAKDQRLTNVEAMALFNIQRRLRRKNYDFKRLIDHSLFVIEDLTYNCIFIRANTLLREMAEFIDYELPEELLTNMNKSEKQLNSLWDEYAQEYFSRDFVSHRLLNESSIAAFMPLYAGCITKDRATRIVQALENEHRFGTIYPVPSVPLDSPWYSSRRYWQGPTWMNTNWLIIDGLKRYGFKDHAEALTESSIELVKKSGFHEYFDPVTGEGFGIDNFSWTASLIVDLMRK
ncbi:MAG TPA: trehalase family glycosidase [Candidatus Saccharimonadales bacterium]